jgi:hypothetical protein
MTDTRNHDRADGTEEEYRPTLGEMSHTNPYTDEVFGDTQTYGRGRFVAADGGADPEREPGADPEGRGDGRTLQDVDHTPPEDSDGAAPAYERGHEGREEVEVADPDEPEPEDVR